MGAAIASRGYKVIGVDVNQKSVDMINRGLAPIKETNLDETIRDNAERFTATLDYEEAIQESDITFVIVPTPSCPDGSFSISYVKECFKSIGKVLKNKDRYHLVVLTSTVLPGATRFGLLPTLEAESGKICGKDFGLCYSPEFIALGSVIDDFLNPDFNLIGEFDLKSGNMLEQCYRKLMRNIAPIKRMSIENAELTKVALNTFITTKITFANMLAEISSHIFGADIDIITDALGCDKRIGRKYLTGGLGYGGTCFPRDNVALSFISDAVGCNSDIAKTTDKLNNDLTFVIGNKILSMLKKDDVIGILGLSFKPTSGVIEESQSIKLAEYFNSKNFKVVGYDPLANSVAASVLKNKISIVNTAKECILKSDVVIVATSDPSFLNIEPSDFPNKQIVVYDCWRLLQKKLENVPNIIYIALGIEPNTDYAKNQLKNLWDKE